MAEPRIQTLASSNDWDRWIILIEMMTGAMGIWDYIDPDQPNKKPPEKPTFSSTEGKTEADKELMMLEFQAQLFEWDRYLKARWKLWKLIITSLAPQHYYLIRKERSLQQALIKLRDRFRKSDLNVGIDIAKEWGQLRQGWPRNRTMEQWVDQWIGVYLRGKDRGLPLFQDEDTRTQEFLDTIKPFATGFVKFKFKEMALGKSPGFQTVVQQFHTRYQEKKARSDYLNMKQFT